jgi:acyl-CoA thioester hydrolase
VSSLYPSGSTRPGGSGKAGTRSYFLALGTASTHADALPSSRTAPFMSSSASSAVRPSEARSLPFRVRERVRWEDVDLAGIMRYSAYTRFHDVVEAELLRAAGWTAVTIVDRLGIWLPRRVLHLEYHAPALFDAELEARLWIATIGGTSLTLAGELWSADGRTRHASWHLVLVCVDATSGAKRPVPDELARALAPFRMDEGAGAAEG